VSADEPAVLFNCAIGVKYPLPAVTRRLDCRQPIDYGQLAAESRTY
jgi:threonine synthase